MSPIAPLARPAQPEPVEGSAQLSTAAKRFEAIFVRQMLAAARKTSFGDELFGGQEMDTFRQLLDERFADVAAERGSFGIARMIEAQLGAGERASTSSARADLATMPIPAQPELVEGHAPRPGTEL